MSCSVKTCKSLRRLMPPDSKVSFHRFPKDEDRYRQWLSIVGLNKNRIYSKHMYVCSNHFTEDDYCGPKKALLKDKAVPRLESSSHLLLPCSTEPEHLSVRSVSSLSSYIKLEEPTILDSAIESRDKSLVDPLLFSPVGAQQRSGQSTSFSFKPETNMNSKRPSSFIIISNNLGLTQNDKLQISFSSVSDVRDNQRKMLKTDHEYSFQQAAQSLDENHMHPMSILPIEVTTEETVEQSTNTTYLNARSEDNTTDNVPTNFSSLTSGLTINSCKKYIKKDHPYSKSPGNIEHKTNKTVNSLKDVLRHLSTKKMLSTKAFEHLRLASRQVPKLAESNNMLKAKYSNEFKKFAAILHFYSAKAYKHVRQTLEPKLPNPNVIRKLSKYGPGYSETCFNIISKKVEEADAADQQIICSLLLNDIPLKKQIDFDGNRTWGYVDVGVNIANDQLHSSSEVLLLMLVCNNASWKLPIGYFFVNSLTAAEKANIVTETLIRLHKIGVEVTSVTGDGPSAHFAMFQELGCDFKSENIESYFQHPVYEERKVFAIFDAGHLMNLMRNCLGMLKTFEDQEGNFIEWEYIENVYDLQENDYLALGNKAGEDHKQWVRHKMKLKNSSHTLNNSAAEALQFLSEEILLPDFEDCGATIKFLKTIDTIFEILNSKSPLAEGFKAPLSMNNEANWRPVIENSIKYLLSIKNLKTFLKDSNWKTPFLGFVVSLKSVMGMFDEFVTTGDLDCLLTHNSSQDHLEEFICSVRSGNKSDNLTCLQFVTRYSELVLNLDIPTSSANCKMEITTADP